MNKVCLSTAILAFFCIALPATATESVSSSEDTDVRFSGFYSLTATHYDAPKAYMRDLSYMTYPQTDHTSVTTDSRIGLQIEAPITPQLTATTQLLGAEHIQYGLGDGVQWAFLKYKPTDILTFRVGRLGIDIFMLSDYRNVSYAYPWTRPVQDYYGFLPLFFFDGADVAWQKPFDEGVLRLKVSAGTSQASFNGSRLHMRDFRSSDLEWQADNWRARISYGSFYFRNNPDYDTAKTALNNLSGFWPEANRLSHALELTGHKVQFLSLGTEIDYNNWWNQTEVGSIKMGNDTLFGNVLTAYSSLGYRFGNWLPYVTLSTARSRHPYFTASELPPPLSYVPDLQMLRTGVINAVNQLYVKQNTVSLGVRWDVKPQTAVKLQYDDIRAKPNGQAIWGGWNATNPDTLRGRVLTLSVDGTF